MYNLPGAAVPAPPAEAAAPAAGSAAPENSAAPAAAAGTAADAAEEFAAASVAEVLPSARSRADEDGEDSSFPRSGEAAASSSVAPAAADLFAGADDRTGGAEPARVSAEKIREAVDVGDKTAPAAEQRALTREEEIEEALSCPCIDAMREGPCGNDFIAAYRCFLESDSEPKGMDCVPQFATMQSCMAEHPEEYNLDDDEDPIGSLASVETNDHAQLDEHAEKYTENKETEVAEDNAVSSKTDEPVVAPLAAAASQVETSTQPPPDAPAVQI